MFTHTSDQALQRWDTPEGQYAVAVDRDSLCPAGQMATGRNCARRVVTSSPDWSGDTSVLDGPHVIATTSYNGYSFEAAAADMQEAEMIASVYAQWAEGDVFAVGFEGVDGTEDTLYGVYTADGTQPDLDFVKAALGRS